jgi:hypothetical protein
MIRSLRLTAGWPTPLAGEADQKSVALASGKYRGGFMLAALNETDSLSDL